jgi:hypothetical protein
MNRCGRRRAGELLLPKQEIIEWLAKNGDPETAFEVEANLPEQVDTDQDRELLAQVGVDVESLLDQHRA